MRFTNNFIFFLLVVFLPCLSIGQNEDANYLGENFEKLDSLSQKKRVDSLLLKYRRDEIKESQVYHDYSVVLYNSKRRNEAMDLLRKAIDLRRRFVTENNAPLRKSLLYLGIYYKSSGDYFKAIEAIKESVEFQERDDNTYKGYSQLVLLYEKTGDFEKSIEYFNRVEGYYINKKDFRNLLRSYIRIANVYLGNEG